ncbi:hypothetical protein SAMN05660477_00158 [Soonwooa buanensis]|uniref:CarboxypepD_reg-like domain-containing protein n=1 Tax=Soonwooa buanensis TaxID=619805 RepID=A0A1T5CLM3_9FLAO|nr:hypothetical protein [Soonwooa buanensis]SKB60294.1 hypothetical protein SAMN05660477_00158 [Soonwooa buanensis]
MIKKIYALFLICFAVFAFSQSTIKVTTAGKTAPLAQASVYCNNKLLGITDIHGSLNFKTKCDKVTVKHQDYEDADVVVDKIMEVSLEKEESNVNKIEGVVVNDKSDARALAILDKVNSNFKNNSPKSLESYEFKSYEKMSFDFDEDSVKIYQNYMAKRKDSLNALPVKELKQTKKEKKDSLMDKDFENVMIDSKLFLWERANQYLYSEKFGEKINVLDNRISGLKEPIYQLLVMRSNRNKIPKEILPENRNLYRYYLTDSIEIDGRENYVIRFREVGTKTQPNRRKYNGYLYIDQQSFAVKKIESNSKNRNDGSVTSVWTPINNKWFLQKENLKLRAGSQSFDNTDKKPDIKDDMTAEEKRAERRKLMTRFGNYVYMKVDYFDFETPVDFTAKDFKGYTMTVKNTDGSLLDKYRTDSLTMREKLTYVKVDSLGQKYNVDKKASLVSNLMRGRIRLGMVDVDPFGSNYNRYEGIRLAIRGKLNENFNKYISPDAYVAYGFKDSKFKYGVGVDVKTTLDYNSFFRAEYYDDVESSGRFSQNLWSFKMQFMNSGVDLQNDKFYRFQGGKLSYEVDLNNALTMRLSAKRQNEEAKFDYFYNNENRLFKNFSTMLTLKYSPNSQNIMTPSGKLTYDQKFPEIYFNFEQGMKTLGGEFNYSRVDVLLTHQFSTKLGRTGVRLYGGLMTGDAPIWHHFQMGGLDSSNNDSFFSHFNLTTYLGFATMEAGKYFNDKFMGYYFTHRIPWYFKSFGRNTSSFDLVYKGTIGDMKNMGQHQFNYNKLDHLYQEVGLEYNNFLSTGFNLGLFYRVGHYSTNKFSENFAIQLKLKFLGF